MPRPLGTDGPQRDLSVRPGDGKRADQPPGSREPGPLSKHLDQIVEGIRRVVAAMVVSKKYRQLDEAQILGTLRLRDRIRERFPQSGLRVCQRVLASPGSPPRRGVLRRPLWPLRRAVAVASVSSAPLCGLQLVRLPTGAMVCRSSSRPPRLPSTTSSSRGRRLLPRVARKPRQSAERSSCCMSCEASPSGRHAPAHQGSRDAGPASQYVALFAPDGASSAATSTTAARSFR